MNFTMFALLQVTAEQLVESLSGAADEPHEKILYAVVTALVTILTAVVIYIANQLLHRSRYNSSIEEATKKLSNPSADKTFNGKHSSATLMNVVIDQVKDVRRRQETIIGRIDTLGRFENLASKDDIKRLDSEIRDLRKRVNGIVSQGGNT